MSDLQFEHALSQSWLNDKNMQVAVHLGCVALVRWVRYSFLGVALVTRLGVLEETPTRRRAALTMNPKKDAVVEGIALRQRCCCPWLDNLNKETGSSDQKEYGSPETQETIW